jgi:hypothetical protein
MTREIEKRIAELKPDLKVTLDIIQFILISWWSGIVNAIIAG